MRSLLTSSLFASFLVLPVLVACGGGNTEPPATTPTASSSASATPAPTASAQAKPATVPLETLRRQFLDACSQGKVSAPDYCECGWDELRKRFTEEEMSGEHLPPEKFARYKEEMRATCGSKLPEEASRDGFIADCASDGKEAIAKMKPYCECKWTEFRKKFSVAELGDEAIITSDRFKTSLPPIAKACNAKLPEDVIKTTFVKACSSDPKKADFCGCAWTALRKQVSPAQIDLQSFDEATVMAQVKKSCASKLK